MEGKRRINRDGMKIQGPRGKKVTLSPLQKNAKRNWLQGQAERVGGGPPGGGQKINEKRKGEEGKKRESGIQKNEGKRNKLNLQNGGGEAPLVSLVVQWKPGAGHGAAPGVNVLKKGLPERKKPEGPVTR